MDLDYQLRLPAKCRKCGGYHANPARFTRVPPEFWCNVFTEIESDDETSDSDFEDV
jgi:hypothetical protein